MNGFELFHGISKQFLGERRYRCSIVDVCCQIFQMKSNANSREVNRVINLIHFRIMLSNEYKLLEWMNKFNGIFEEEEALIDNELCLILFSNIKVNKSFLKIAANRSKSVARIN